MGLLADITKPAHGSCSNGGISASKDAVTIVNVSGPFEPDDDRPAVLLVPGNVAGSVKIVPAEKVDGDGYLPIRNGLGPMMGGTYIASSDSRFAEAIEQLIGARFYGAVAFHDRFETADEYRMFSA